MKANFSSLDGALKCKSYGVFVNENGEHCTVSVWYVKSKKHIQVCFTSLSLNEQAKRFAINTSSEKKVVKILNDENFQLLVNK